MSYTHLTIIERGKLEAYLALNFSYRKIAKLLGRHHSTIAREVSRNKHDYQSITAQNSYENKKKFRKVKTKLHESIISVIEEKLLLTWSPEQIANTVLHKKISFKTIYNWIYSGKINSNNLQVLRHKGKKRKGVEKRGIFSNGTSIKERSEKANNRSEFGHWELDSVLSSRGESKGVIFTCIERKSRLFTAFISENRTAHLLEKAIQYLFSTLPKGVMKSVTSDRGKEFACHAQIKDNLKIDFFFADAYAPWQRGSNENANGLLREFYPKQTDLSKINQQELREKLELINNRPRKCLNWKTPIQVFLQEVSHLR